MRHTGVEFAVSDGVLRIYTGDLTSAKEALELGLVNKVINAETLPAEAARVIEKIKSKSQRSIRLVKKAANEGLSDGLEDGPESERSLYSSVLGSPGRRRTSSILFGGGPGSGRGRSGCLTKARS